MNPLRNNDWRMKLTVLAVMLLLGAGGWRALQSQAAAREQQLRSPLLVTPPVVRPDTPPTRAHLREAAPALAMATITVTNTSDGAAPGPVGSLRRAISNAAAGDTINFSLPNPSTITLTNGNLFIDKSLTISGPGATALTIDGNSNGRVFWLVNAPNVSFSGLTITNGLADFGGGINSQHSGVSIDACAIIGNRATGGAAGINIHTGSTATITDTTISGNLSSAQSGGVQVNDATATLTNCTISGNTATVATGVAGLEFSSPTTITLINCTVANHSPHGVFTQDATIRLQNTLVANNTRNFVNNSGTITSLGHNLDSDGRSGFTNGMNGDIVGTTGSPLNALLSPLNNHGGSTNTLALLPGSPAINAGTGTDAPSLDQRGVARVGATDIGAFESRGFALALAGGNNQTTVVSTNFASPLSVLVTANSMGEPVDGGRVTFTPPGSGASATIGGNPATIASSTASSGTVSANGTGGTYNVAANANGAASSVNFSLTNNVAPTVLSIMRGNASPTSSGSVPFNVTFSESVTGGANSNFAVAASGVSGASVTNVAGSGSTRVVTVNTGTGSGTVGLNMTNSTGVTDSDGAAISNLTFTGQVYTIDKTAPTTSITANPTNPSASTTAGFSFTGSDTGGAGLTGFECQLDGGGFSACTSPQTYTTLSQGSHTFQVRALDAVGNMDATPATYTWVIDTVVPDTTITANPPNPSASANASFSFTGSDPGGSGVASFQCQLDGGGFSACTSPRTYTGLSDGSHTFQVRAIDAAGNVDSTPASFTWTIDTTGPDTTITATPPNPSATANANFSFTGNDGSGTGVASFQCQLDGGGFSTCTSPLAYTGLSDGSHTFQVRAVDAVGNADSSPASFAWGIDTAAPDTTITANPSNPSANANASFSFIGNDGSGTGVASFQCQLDSGGFGTCTSPLAYTGLSDGSHTFQVRAIDAVGNTDQTPASFTWVIDTTAPNTTITATPTNPSASANASFSFMGNDGSGTGVASFQCQLDGGGFSPCSSPQAYTGLSAGSHTFQVRALDAVGNTDQTPASFTWVIDTIAPDTTITATPSNPSASANASFSFTGNDGSGSGVAGFECQLDGGAFIACASPRTYSGLSDGSHTFQVRAVDVVGNADSTPASFTWMIDTTAPNTTITANPTNPSGSANASFSFTGSDPGGSGIVSFECQLDGGGFSVCTSPRTYTGLSDGSHTFQVRANDAVGNADSSPASFTWAVDVTPPDTTITSYPANPTSSTNASFSFTGNDGGGVGVASFECKFDAGAFTACASPQTYTSLSAGSHTFQVRAIDSLGNLDQTPASYTWLIDTAAPTASLSASNVTMMGGTLYTFTVTYSDNTALNSASFDSADVTVTGPGGPLAVAFGSAVPGGDGTPRTVSYSITPPGGSWDNADGGSYTITMAANQVTDTVGNAVVAGPLGSFQVLICNSLLMVNDLGDTADATPGNGICADAAGKCTLRAAIMEANATPVCSPLTINFSVTGTINLASALPALDHPNLTITGPGADQLGVHRNVVTAFRIFTINSGKTVGISGLTISNGNANDGGGIRNTGSLTVDGCVLAGNTGTGNGGGGIANTGLLTVANCSFSGNTGALAGGGLLQLDGGIANVTGSTFSGNSAQQGGAVANQGISMAANLTLTNCTISGNTATTHTAGVLSIASGATTTLALTNCTIANNSAPGTGGVRSGVGSGTATFTFRNTIFASNAPVNVSLLGGTNTSLGNNLSSDGSGGGGASDLLNTNPLLAPLGNYGGTAQTHALLPGSPAINAGHNCVLTNSCASNNLGFNLTNDQRGLTRVGSVDIGAVEAQAFTLAIIGGNNQSTVVNTAFPTALQVNLKEGANNLPGAVITFTGPGSGASLNPVSGTATTDANGIAIRTVAANTLAGGPYAVAATTGALSQPFSLTNLPGAPAQLAFGQQPGNTPAAAPISPAVTVRVLDAFGNLTPSNATVTLALGANPGGATLGGTTTVNALSGVATFSTLALNKIGTGYTLVAGSASLAGATSTPFNITCPTITLSSLPAGTAGTAYNQTVTALPAGGGYTFAVTGGTLPANLSLASNGTISGTPTTAGTFNFTITATGFASGQGSCTSAQTYNLVINCPTITLTPAILANGVQGTPYNQTVAAAPAGTTYTFAVTANALPPGLSLNSATGAITGTPTAAGNYAFVITATGWANGSSGCTKAQSYNVLISGTCAGITFNASSLLAATVGTVYNQTVTATGGVAPYTFSVAGGALPAGLILEANTGALTGTPTASGSFAFTLKATAQGGCFGTRTYILTVACASLTFNPPGPGLPNGTVNLSYSQTLTVTPAGTYTFSFLLGSLPPGYALSSTGVLSGVTNQTGTYNFTIKGLSGACQATKAYTLVIGVSQAALAQLADYDGDGKSDFVLWSNNGMWRLSLSNGSNNGVNRQAQTQSWGAAGDVSLLGDYDGDGQSDLAVFRPANGTWYVKRSSDDSLLVKAWGAANDVPVPGDYDGDGKTDLAVFRPSDGHWYVLRSSDQQSDVTAWGAGYAPYGDVAVPGDYDGDGKTDLAVFRRATGTWLVKRSSDSQSFVKQWGAGADVPVAADYDGDGQTDLAVWRLGVWCIWQSTTDSLRVEEWGASSAPYFDQAVPGDYDGDGQTDLAVWRAGDQTWYVQCSQGRAVITQAQGQVGDRTVRGK